MRVRVGLIVALVLLAGAVVLVARGDSRPARAQPTEPRPLLWNEVEDWCMEERCSAVYETLSDGYLRVVLNARDGELEAMCPRVTIPADVEGLAYAKVVDSDRLPMPVYPTASAGQSQSEAEATWVASFPDDEVAVISVAEARQLPETASICELVVKRVS